MIRFQFNTTDSGKTFIRTCLKGKELLTNPFLNKGTAFSLKERKELGLAGKLPPVIETLEAQVKRAYEQFEYYQNALQKHIFLNNLHDKNSTLFYKLVGEHLTEMLPIIYTPIVGSAVEQFSHEFRQPRGLYITPNDVDNLDIILANRTHPDVKLVVITDGKGVLGLGDQGVGAIEIPIAKLMVYSLLGGVNPAHTLPIMLDMGTDNETLLKDPFYLGLRQPRLKGKEFHAYIDKFMCALRKAFPKTFFHWEDLGRDDARAILNRYQDTDCTFNDDIQGTGAVATSAIVAASLAQNIAMDEHRIVIFGAGTAGVGIADQIYDYMLFKGIDKQVAKNSFCLLDRPGLLCEHTDSILDFQKPYARETKEILAWGKTKQDNINLLDVVKHIKPTILIGASAQHGAFDEAVIKAMCEGVEHPIICPLSNPNALAEAYPADILRFSNGKAMVATGSPFSPVTVEGVTRSIAQCNNALIFPGLGLGVLAAQIPFFTNGMLLAAIEALAKHAPVLNDPLKPILSGFDQAKDVAKEIAIAVIKQASQDNLIELKQTAEQLIENYYWQPEYLEVVEVVIDDKKLSRFY